MGGEEEKEKRKRKKKENKFFVVDRSFHIRTIQRCVAPAEEK
jgi:hypothetical protein